MSAGRTSRRLAKKQDATARHVQFGVARVAGRVLFQMHTGREELEMPFTPAKARELAKLLSTAADEADELLRVDLANKGAVVDPELLR